jgi:hypothetical protein
MKPRARSRSGRKPPEPQPVRAQTETRLVLLFTYCEHCARFMLKAPSHQGPDICADCQAKAEP